MPYGCVMLEKDFVLCPDFPIATDQIVEGGELETFVTNTSDAFNDPNGGESLAVRICGPHGGLQTTLLRDADVGSITVDTKNPATYVSYKMQGATLHLSREQVVAKVNNFLAKK